MAFLEALVERIRTQNLEIYGVPTSYDTLFVARDYGLRLFSLQDIDQVDLALDGADEVDPHLNLIKGAGGAFTWEKLVAMNAAQFVVLIDERKKTPILGTTAPVPVEVLPRALRQVTNALTQMGAHPTLRKGSGKLGPVVTDFGNFIIDAKFPQIPEPRRLEQELNQIPGVVDNGIFATKPPRVLVGYPDKVETLETTPT
jgi:ribose 5-phosphate isomerase A